MDEITDKQWAAVYQKIFLRYQEIKRRAIMTGDQFDEMNNLRLMINAYGSGKRTQNLYDKMKAAAD